MEKVLIIDDERPLCKMLVDLFKLRDIDTSYALSLEQGLEQLHSDEFGVVFLDVNLPDGNGLQAIETIKKHESDPEIIIITGYGDQNGVELAMKSGAWDYLQKGGSHKEFVFSLDRALKYRQQKQPKTAEIQFGSKPIIGDSQQIRTSLEKVAKASRSDVSVLISGETGTGKELFAKAIHENSRRRNNDFIIVDCAALPQDLVESVLFGHTRGAFTGADSDKLGLIQLADKGTLFLDEVGELPLIVQKKFLRVLQEKKIRPIGGKKEVSSDFRLVCATHRDLKHMVEKGSLREDFYFRISATKIEIPPLRLRKSDIPALVSYYISLKNDRSNECPGDIDPQFMTELLGYDWPGNVRELLNVIDHACVDSDQGSILFPKHLPSHIRTFNITNKMTKSGVSASAGPPAMDKIPVDTLTLKAYVEKMKQGYVRALLEFTRGDKKEACRLSGLSTGHLYSLLKKFEMNQS